MGLHFPRPARLTGWGVKPIQPYAPLYHYYWLYAAVEPLTGESCWCERPHLDAACFQAFLEHLSQPYPLRLNLLVVDQAPAHTARALCLPENILLLRLPPYSPELNPIERLWHHLKAQIDVFDRPVRSSVTALRDHVADLINRYRPEQLRSLTAYDYIIHAGQSHEYHRLGYSEPLDSCSFLSFWGDSWRQRASCGWRMCLCR